MRTVDLFAGAGGFTAGAEQAGATVVWAANHWRQSVDVHQANHPGVKHSCQDLQQADWSRVPAHDLLVASPACQGHAQPGQPNRKGTAAVADRHKADRNTAWAVVSAAEVCRPSTIIVENVADFLRWTLLPHWQGALETLGYHVERHTFDCATFGVAQNRVRAIITARQCAPLRLTDPGLAAPAFGPLIEWGTGPWFPLASKPDGVRKRVDAARKRGLGARFLTHYVTGHRGRELDRPIGCITTKVQWAVVDGDRTRMLTTGELGRGMGFSGSYLFPTGKTLACRMLGNAIPPPFAKEIVRQAMEGAA